MLLARRHRRGARRASIRLRDQYELALVTLPLARARLYVTMKNYLDLVALRARESERGRTAERYRYELGELVVDRARDLVGARHRQAARAHPREEPLRHRRRRRQRLHRRGRRRSIRASARCASRCRRTTRSTSTSREFTFPVDDKIDRRARRHLAAADQHPDIYDLRAATVQLRSAASTRVGYRTRSMLRVPLINQRDEVIGVIQLINKSARTASRSAHGAERRRRAGRAVRQALRGAARHAGRRRPASRSRTRSCTRRSGACSRAS